LVEVVLALGVAGISLLTIIGLLSTANDTGKRARDEGAAARLTINEFERLRSLTAASSFWPTDPATPPTNFTKYYDSNQTDLGTAKTANADYELNITFSTAPTGSADFLVNAEVRYPAQAPKLNQSSYRFTTLLNHP
jgi:uncharacterized protein (TIGR02598 family)